MIKHTAAPIKHWPFTQCCSDVGPASKTVGQHHNIIGGITVRWAAFNPGPALTCSSVHVYTRHRLDVTRDVEHMLV